MFSGGNRASRGSDFIYGEALVFAAAAGVPTAGSGSFYTYGIVNHEVGHWDGAQLSPLISGGGPALAGATLTAQPGTSRLWLVGSNDGSTASSATYYFDVGATALAVPGETGIEPLLRSRHAAGFVDGQLVLVGGSDEARDLSRFQSPD